MQQVPEYVLIVFAQKGRTVCFGRAAVYFTGRSLQLKIPEFRMVQCYQRAAVHEMTVRIDIAGIA